MTLDDLLEKIGSMVRVQELDREYIGSCPCFNVSYSTDQGSVHILGKCWRVSEGDEEQDLYVWGSAAPTDLERIGLRLKANLDQQEWYNPYLLRLEEPSWN